MVVVSGDMPGAAYGLALGVDAAHPQHHAAQLRAHEVQRAASAVQQPGQCLGARQQAGGAAGGQDGKAALGQAHFQRGAEHHPVGHLVVRGEQLQVGYVAQRAPARGQVQELHRLGSCPAAQGLPAALRPDGDGQAAVAQHGGQRGFAARGALCGGDADVDGGYALPASAQVLHHRRRQRRHGAGTADGGAPGGGECGMQGRGKVADKAAAIGQVDVVGVGCCGGLRHGIGLLLERARRVDHQANAVVAQPLRKAGGAVVHGQPLRAVAQRGGQRLGLGGAAATHHQLHGGIARQGTADACAEVAVAAQYQRFQVAQPRISPASALRSRPPSPAHHG